MQEYKHNKNRAILPTLLSMVSLSCGITSIILSSGGDFVLSSVFILIAGFFDAIDGKVARLVNQQCSFGIQIDSLVDMVSFVISPVILIYNLCLFHLGYTGLIPAFIFCACGCIRLARFNCMQEQNNKPCTFFTGLPTPAAGYYLAVTVLFVIDKGYRLESNRIMVIISGIVVLLALLMVSRIPYFSFKHMNKPQKNILAVMAVVAAIAMFINPIQIAIIILTGYLLVGFGVAIYSHIACEDDEEYQEQTP